jgi:hypothetical protein
MHTKVSGPNNPLAPFQIEVKLLHRSKVGGAKFFRVLAAKQAISDAFAAFTPARSATTNETVGKSTKRKSKTPARMKLVYDFEDDENLSGLSESGTSKRSVQRKKSPHKWGNDNNRNKHNEDNHCDSSV